MHEGGHPAVREDIVGTCRALDEVEVEEILMAEDPGYDIDQQGRTPCRFYYFATEYYVGSWHLLVVEAHLEKEQWQKLVV